MRDWLISHGYMKTETQKKRDEVVDLFRKNYDWSASKSLAYLTWRLASQVPLVFPCRDADVYPF